MKLLLSDFLSRWKWVYLLVGVLQLSGGLFTSSNGPSFAPFLSIGCGAMLLSFDLTNGTARVCRSLPLSGHELARSWRFLALVVPMLLSTAALVLGNLLRVAFNFGAAMTLSQGTLSLAYAFLWLGISFYLLTHLPRPTPQGFEQQAKAMVVGGLWGFSAGGGILLSMTLPKDWQSVLPWLWCTMVGAGVLTCLGWLRAELMIISRSASAQTGESRTASPRAAMPLARTRLEGLPFLFGTSIWFSLGTIGMFVVVYMCVQILLRRGPHESLDFVAARTFQEPTIFFILAPLLVINGLRWLVTVRHLRVLPLSGSKVAFVVAAVFMIPSFIMVALMVGLQMLLGSQPLSSQWLNQAMLMTVPALLMPALLLHFGLSRQSFFIAIFAAPMLGILAPQISNLMCGLIWVGAWAAGAWLLRRAISARSQAYRQPINWPMGGA